MTPNELLNKVTATINNTSLSDDPSIIAAGPITKQPATNRYRIVLRHIDGQFVVHDQIWNSNGAYSFSHGEYFKAISDDPLYPFDSFIQAITAWTKRVTQDLQHIPSINREV
jgi:hypothetical protein